MANYKSLAQRDALADELAKRPGISSYSQLKALDSSNNPLLTVAATIPLISTGPGAFIRISPPDSLFLNVVGHAQDVFQGNICDIAFEAAPLGTNTIAITTPIISAAVQMGMRVRVWEEDSGTEPHIHTFADATKLKYSFDPSVQYPSPIIGQ